MLELRQVYKKRELAGGKQIEILKGVSFHVEKGSIACLLGASGSGKSTILRLVNRLEDPDSGQIMHDGANITALRVQELRQRVGMVLQKPTLFTGSVYENVIRSFVYHRQTPPEADDPFLLELLELVQLDAEILNRSSSELSVGQQMRVSLVRTLITRPSVLLLDEPTSALDPRTGADLLDQLKRHLKNSGTTALVTTHNMDAVRKIADTVLFLDGGVLAEQGTPSKMLDHPDSERLRHFLAGEGKIPEEQEVGE